MPLGADAQLTRLALRVKDLERCLGYYSEVLGFSVVQEEGARTSLALPGRRFVIDLIHEPSAVLRPYPCVGLYHFALVVPDRPALGAVFRHLVDRKEAFEGMADHAVSEALYIRDPEQNGIELYRDRPHEEWPYTDGGGSGGLPRPKQVAMVSDPLDVDGVVGAAENAAPLHADTRFGHIHLHVSELPSAEAFFADELGLGVTQRSLPGALFFAAGDYHHHVAANTWAPERPVPPDATGLLGYTWLAPGWTGPSSLRDPVGAEVRFETG
jgi:catechol 2,3-dioxygenase